MWFRKNRAHVVSQVLSSIQHNGTKWFCGSGYGLDDENDGMFKKENMVVWLERIAGGMW